jgi:anthranilate synthase component II
MSLAGVPGDGVSAAAPDPSATDSTKELPLITVIDNYDSFTYNLVQQIERLAGERLEVVRNDEFDPVALLESEPAALVISPGPGSPARAGRCVELIRANRSIPLLGVCLGHQAIAEAFGARVVRGTAPVHGKVSEVAHEEAGLFAGCEHPVRAARYHSLVVARDSLPPELRIDAWTDDGEVMALSHRERPVFGIQFHPESYGTGGGDRLIANFLEIATSGRLSAEGGVR